MRIEQRALSARVRPAGAGLRRKSHIKLDTTRPYNWSGSSVTGILDNKVYLGHMAGLRTTSISYKNKKQIRKPESEQILVENTHEPLISKEQWDIVQDVRQHKKRASKHMEEPNLFSDSWSIDWYTYKEQGAPSG